jgi:uncharacterized protein (DUF362 family)
MMEGGLIPRRKRLQGWKAHWRLNLIGRSLIEEIRIMTIVAITHHDDIEQSITSALDHLDIEPLIRGKLVAVKPNETWASREDKTAVTQPDSLRAALRYLKQFSPRKLVVTGGAGAGETDEIFELAGLMDVVREQNVEFFDHNRPPFQSVELEYRPDKDVAGPQESVMVNPRVLTYDTVVSLNQLKVHETATVTLSLKNIAMSHPAADYYGHPRSTERHQNHFFSDMHSFIAAMAKRFPVQLTITVGHPAMIGMGPIGGYTFETGLTIASTDALAADVVGARLLGFSVRGVHHLWEAARLGVGECELENMRFPAMSIEEAFGVFTEAAYGKRLELEHA